MDSTVDSGLHAKDSMRDFLIFAIDYVNQKKAKNPL